MKPLALALTVLVVLASPAVAGWEEDLDRLLAMEPGEERDALVAKVAEGAPGCAEIAARIRAAARPAAKAGAILTKRKCTDGVERPWVVVVPDGYDPAKPTPLVVGLHGLVTRKEIIEDPAAYAEQTLYTKLARARGWLTIVPFGQVGATWFDEVGMENLRAILREVKRGYHVDDDRVYMAGFSDGASGGFHYAMVEPSDYAAFLALNGHMGVGSQYAKVDTYAVNMANSPVYVMTSDRDGLYATAKMRPSIEMAIEAGARIFYRQFAGGHDYEHVRPELGNLGDWLLRHPRDPFPGRVVWETADADRFGACRWFAIDEVTSGPRRDWHKDHNVVLTDDRITIGFQSAEHEAKGVLVSSVVEGSFAESVGLLAGDIVVEFAGEPVPGMEGLGAAKKKVVPGKATSVVVIRDGKEVTLTGDFPDRSRYWIFEHRRRSALAHAAFAANRIDVKTSRVGALRILVHPEMVNLADPLTITANGKKLFEAEIEPDPTFLLSNYLANRDRKLLYVAEVKVKVPME